MNLLIRPWLMAVSLMLTFQLNLRAADADLPIFTDQMVGGFEMWGWAPHSMTNTTPVHSGTRSISVTASAWTGLFIHHAELNTSAFTNLSLWVHGGEAGGQILRVSVKAGTNDGPGYSLPSLPGGKWQQFQIPLELLGANNITNFTGFLLLLQGDGSADTFYLDDMRLEARPPPPPPPKVIVNESQVPSEAAPTVPEQHQASQPSGGKEAGAFPLWIAAALVAIIGVLVWQTLVMKRNAPAATHSANGSVALLPRPTKAPATTEPPGGEDWRQRALTAEALATRQAYILQENLVPHMAEFAKSSLTQQLASQRNGLLETQRRAEQELMELEARLAALHLPLRERILVYERRIAELEKELATRGEEMRELISATLSLVRQRLEEEKKKDTVGNGKH